MAKSQKKKRRNAKKTDGENTNPQLEQMSELWREFYEAIQKHVREP